jgi:repressor LexA
MEKLTVRQRKAFEFIYEHTQKCGCAPTLRELCEFMGYNAVGSAQDVVASLRRKGYLQTPVKQAARSLILSDQAKNLYAVNANGHSGDFMTVPCLGSVPAGRPLEAIEDPIGYLSLSINVLPRPLPTANQLFALRAEGLSMINAGILDGDWLVVRHAYEASAGSIVVARTGEDATVKRLMKDGQRGWYLQPENPNFEPIFAKQTPFEVIGKVVALQRSYD